MSVSLQDEARRYELGVADFVRHRVGPDASVEFDAKIRGDSGVLRQIDIAVRQSVFGFTDALLIVDAKRWAKKVDINDVGAFAELVADVRAHFGLLVASTGFTSGAAASAARHSGMTLEVVSLADLPRWVPKGTVEVTVMVDRSDAPATASTLLKAHLRSEERPNLKLPDKVYVCAFRHYGRPDPTPEQQTSQYSAVADVLSAARIPFEMISHGVTIGGGTPAHQWIDIKPLDVSVLAGDRVELESQIDIIAQTYGLPRDLLSADIPEGWDTGADERSP